MKTAFLFSGQGAQVPGMFKELYETERAVREVFSVADETLGHSISELCFTGTQEELNLTHNTQPCVMAADIAAAMALCAHGIRADAVAGFSLGEYAALVYAGSLSLTDAFRVIQIRADAMQEAVPVGMGAMAAVIGADAHVVEDICKEVTEGYVIPANYNSPVQTVISGSTVGIDAAVSKMEGRGLRVMKLAVSAPFHCALMEPAARRLEQEFKAIPFEPPSVPVYMNVDGQQYTEAREIPSLLVKQAMSPVQWRQTLENMYQDGFDTFIECGPGKTLTGLVKKTLKGAAVHRVEDAKTLASVLAAFGKS